MSYETKLLWKKRLLMLWCCFVDVHNLVMGRVPEPVQPGSGTQVEYLGWVPRVLGFRVEQGFSSFPPILGYF